MSHFSRGVRLGVDVGQVRIGVAICDPDGILATPLVTVRRAPAAAGGGNPGDPAVAGGGTPGPAAAGGGIPADIAELARIVASHGAVEVIVGLPVTLAGRDGPAATQVRAYAARLAEAIAPVRTTLTDERMSTVVATRRLSERGVRGRRQRAVVDQAAAVEILQSWLDAQRRRTTT